MNNMVNNDELKEKEAFKKFADKLKMKELEGEGERIKALRKMVQEFEEKYGTDIHLMPPDLQIKYREMRKEAGLPEISEKEIPELSVDIEKDKSNYISKLAHVILRLGIENKEKTGGVQALSELIVLLKTKTPFKNVKVNNVKKALKKLQNEGLIPGIIKLENGVEIVEFIPLSLNRDQNILLTLASKDGYLDIETAIIRLNWSQERILRALYALEKANIAKKDPRYSAGNVWYFPGLIKSK